MGTEPDLEHKCPGSQSSAHVYHPLPKSPQNSLRLLSLQPSTTAISLLVYPGDPDYRQEGLVRIGFVGGRWGNCPLPKESLFVKLYVS